MARKKDVNINIKVKGADGVFKKKISCWQSYCCCGGKGFFGFGSALAMILSYTRSESILWVIIHGILSWFYVLYRIIQVWGWI